MQNYYKLARGFSIGDTGIANAGNIINASATLGTNYTDALRFDVNKWLCKLLVSFLLKNKNETTKGLLVLYYI
jgi:hypothetical protein